MQKSIICSEINGVVTAPSSKSIVQRCIAAALLAEGTSFFHNVTLCADDQAALRVAETLGASCEVNGNEMQITGGHFPRGSILDCGESGLALRMFAAIAARYDIEIVLTGGNSLLRRPIDMIISPLRTLGANCQTSSRRLPLIIKGPLHGGAVTIDGSVSSQFLTGLLIVLPTLKPDSVVNVENLKSRPYIDLTLQILKKFGINTVNHGFRQFYIHGNQRYLPVDYTIEGDWSGAAFLLVAGALQGEVTVTGLNLTSAQADRKILEALRICGAKIELLSNAIKVSQAPLHAFEFDATDCPDLFPPLVVLATGCCGTSRISGVERLFFKESNRAAALCQEFQRLGIEIAIAGNQMYITGGTIQGGRVRAHNDHRIAMALAIAGLRSSQPVIIEGSECIVKSYPSFFEDLKQIGGKVYE